MTSDLKKSITGLEMSLEKLKLISLKIKGMMGLARNKWGDAVLLDTSSNLKKFSFL